MNWGMNDENNYQNQWMNKPGEWKFANKNEIEIFF